MDSPRAGPDRHPRLSFGPDLRYTAAAGGGTVLFALITLVTPDAPGRLLFALAALMLAGYVVGDLTFRPRLYFDAAGLRVNSPGQRLQCGWEDVESVRVDERRRLGLTAHTLEIDAADRLVVLSRRALGADPVAVAELAAGFR